MDNKLTDSEIVKEITELLTPAIDRPINALAAAKAIEPKKLQVMCMVSYGDDYGVHSIVAKKGEFHGIIGDIMAELQKAYKRDKKDE